jgi:ATP-dependent DNA helicase RecQ
METFGRTRWHGQETVPQPVVDTAVRRLVRAAALTRYNARMPTIDELLPVIQRTWGFSTLRPLQAEAMQAELGGRDSVVVMPTGGGKSLCYQAPAVLRGQPTVVISPLIALMKDQVDSLRSCGVAAGQIDSSLTSSERAGFQFDLEQGELRLLFVSPERMVMPDFIRLLQRSGVKTFAIDEAHCISHWGHDFRPEYRQLGRIKELFPGSSVHAYTATATPQVRDDIAKQLNLQKPLVLVGNFDRPNLTFRVLARNNPQKQIIEVIERHSGEAGIIYCLRRRDVEEINEFLQSRGVKSLPYHAGLVSEERQRIQDEFIEERCDLIVATVAFGMGIDRSNIRFVLHTAMPKSLEHYQQEAGRAGRDGLEAECILLYSGGDVPTWKRILEKSAQEAGVPTDFLPNAFKHLEDMDRYARGAVCRHRALVGYFGQQLEGTNCGACDLCLGDNELVAEPVVLAQKILSCVARVQERFGINHVISVLRGENIERVRNLRHDQLTTFGLLKEHSKVEIREWIYQLIGQQVLVQTSDEYPTLRLNDASWEVMKKSRTIRLLQPVRKPAKEKPEKSRADVTSWEGVDRVLFESLRSLRLKLATERQVPPYIVFSDATLRELARVRPSTREKMRLVYGIGERKLQDYAEPVLEHITSYCKQQQVAMDQRSNEIVAPPPRASSTTVNASKMQANRLFDEGISIEEVMRRTDKARSTVMQYLAEFLQEHKSADPTNWVPKSTIDEVTEVARRVGTSRLKPIFVELGERVSYDDIRIVVAHLVANEEPV